MKSLTVEEIFRLVDSVDADHLDLEWIKPHNKGQIRKKSVMNKDDFKKMVEIAVDEGHQPGGDLEVRLTENGKVLVGHHDGIYWLESIN